MEVKMEKQTFHNQPMSTQMMYHWLEGQEISKPKKEIRNNKGRSKKDPVVLRQRLWYKSSFSEYYFCLPSGTFQVFPQFCQWIQLLCNIPVTLNQLYMSQKHYHAQEISVFPYGSFLLQCTGAIKFCNTTHMQ